MSGVGTLNEKSLHAQLKAWYARPGDRFEVPLDGYVIDLVRDDLLIEIQTRNFSAMRTKLDRLTADHPVRLVYPIAAVKWLTKLDDRGRPVGRRKSPKKGRSIDVFSELVSIPSLIERANFVLELLLIEEHEVRIYDPRRNRRRGGWSTHERRLESVLESVVVRTPADVRRLTPALEDGWTTADLANEARVTRRLAQQAAYCLGKLDVVTQTGKIGNAAVYAWTA
ncbi:MAG: hypothetical protein OEO77_07365 [Acidimicrobiia bacterium]|nr:hypothetical protein [Acidimicrobiia bacterium]